MTPGTPADFASLISAGQCLTSIEPERFISLTVDGPLTRSFGATALGPPSASISSGTDSGILGESVMDDISTEFLLTRSTGFLSSSHGKRYAMGERHWRLTEARSKAGFRSARAAAIRHGWTPSTYSSHENGQTPLPVEAAHDYARAFGVSPGWLLTGEGPRQRKGVELLGYVGAGAEIIPVDNSGMGEEIDLPPGAPSNTGVVIVRGESMYPRYFDGEKLFYLEDRRPADELIGRECIVHLADGRTLVKILRRGSRRHLYNLESWNAPLIEDQRVEWAAPVRWRG